MRKIDKVATRTATPFLLILILMTSFFISGSLSWTPENTEVQFIIKLDFQGKLPDHQ